MIIYKTVSDYEKIAKVGDRIILNGKGIISGIESVKDKSITFKVSKIRVDGEIVLKKYKGRTNFRIHEEARDQRIALLSKKEFEMLPNPFGYTKLKL